MIVIYSGKNRIELSGRINLTIEGEHIEVNQLADHPQESPYVIQPQNQEQEEPNFYSNTPSYMEEGDYLKRADYLKLNTDEQPTPVQTIRSDASPAMQKHLREGATTLRSLVETWSMNLGVIDAEQPDRQQVLLDCLEENGTAMLSYIDSCGGITKAIIECWEGTEETARTIAMNIAQVSSIVYPPLSQKLELFYKKTS